MFIIKLILTILCVDIIIMFIHNNGAQGVGSSVSPIKFSDSITYLLNKAIEAIVDHYGPKSLSKSNTLKSSQHHSKRISFMESLKLSKTVNNLTVSDQTSSLTKNIQNLDELNTEFTNNFESTKIKQTKNSRRGRTLFYEDQDALIILMIVFPYYFPLWDRLVKTKNIKGLHEAFAEFTNPITNGGRSGRTFPLSWDEQAVLNIMEIICAWPVSIIPSEIFRGKTRHSDHFRQDDQDEHREKREVRNETIISSIDPLLIEDIYKDGQQTVARLYLSTILANMGCHFFDYLFPKIDDDQDKYDYLYRSVAEYSVERTCSYVGYDDDDYGSVDGNLISSTINRFLKKFCFCLKNKS